MKTDKIIESMQRNNIKGFIKYSSARDEFLDPIEKITFLDANENPFNTGLNRYPDPQQQKLKNVMAQIKGVRSSQILFGNGSDEVLDLLFRAFCEPKEDNVITLPPTYGMYKVLAQLNAVETREVVLLQGFQPDVDTILDKTDKNSKLLFLCSPNNPTGNIFSEESVIRLLEEFPGIVVIDEAYIDFSSKKGWLNRLNDYPKLVVTQTLSKAYGLAGIRLGICYASETIIAILNKIKPPYNVNTLTQEAALKQLQNNSDIKIEICRIVEEKDKLSKELLQVDFVVNVFPSEANFILIKVDDATYRYEQLLKAGIVVRNRSSQPLCENCLRITVGTKSENEKLIKALKILKR